MKKNLLLILFLGLIVSSVAQTTMMQRKMLPEKIDTLLINYLNYSKFASLDIIGFQDAIADQFRNLFSSNAKITDEVNPAYYDKNYAHPFDLPVRTMDDYLAKTKENYPKGLFVRYEAIQVDYKGLSILLLKETKGTTKAGLNYKITDTLKLKLNLSPDFKTLKIEEMTVIGYAIAFENDFDLDFIPDALDKCPKEQGFSSGTGCLTKEEKLAEKERKQKEKQQGVAAVPDKNKPKPKQKHEEPPLPYFFAGLTVSAGFNKFNTKFNEDNLGYTNIIKGSKSAYSITGLKQKKQGPFTQIQLDVDYYFGKKKNIGIATGIGLSSFNASFGMDSFHVEYQATDSKGKIYRRVVHVNTVKEDFKMKSLNIPVILQYKFGLGDKANLALGLGVNYHSVSSASVKGTAMADYEAIYHYNNGQVNSSVYDAGVIPDKSSWLITRSNVLAHGGKSSEQEYFEQKKNMCGCDVAIDQSLAKDEKLSAGGALGLIVRANANYQLSEKLWFAVLLQYQSISFTNKSDAKNYKLTDETGSYNVLLRNVEKLKVGSLALGIGIKYTIK